MMQFVDHFEAGAFLFRKNADLSKRTTFPPCSITVLAAAIPERPPPGVLYGKDENR